MKSRKKVYVGLSSDIIHEREAIRSLGVSKTKDGNWERLFETSCKNYAD